MRLGVKSGPFTGRREVDLARLPSETRRELVASMARIRPLIARVGHREHVVSIAVAVGAIAAAVAMAVVGFGDVHAWSQARWAWLGAYTFVGAVAGAGLSSLVVRRRRAGAPPIPQGTYLFPLDLVEVDGARMVVTPLGDALSAAVDETTVTLRYREGRVVTLSGPSPGVVSLRIELLEAQAALELATREERSDRDALAPLRKLGWDVVSGESARVGTPRASERAIGALAGAVLLALVWFARARFDDDARFHAAMKASDVGSFQAYLAVGSRHRAEAQVELATASRRAAGTDPVALDAFIRAFADTPDAEAAKLDLRSACATYASPGHITCNIHASPPLPCKPRPEDSICAAEVDDAAFDEGVRRSDLTALFAMHAQTTDERRRAFVQARIDDRVEAERAAPCASGPVRAELDALFDVVRLDHRFVAVAVVHEGDLGGLEQLDEIVSAVARPPVLTVGDAGTALERADAVWRFRLVKKTAAVTDYLFVADRKGGSHVEVPFTVRTTPRKLHEPEHVGEEQSSAANGRETLLALGFGSEDCASTTPRPTVRAPRP